MNKIVLCIGFFYWHLSFPAVCQQDLLDNLRIGILSLEKDTNMAWALRDMAYFQEMENLDSAIAYSGKATEKENLIQRQFAQLVQEKRTSRGIVISSALLSVILLGTWLLKKTPLPIPVISFNQSENKNGSSKNSPQSHLRSSNKGLKSLVLENVNKNLPSPLTPREWEIVLLVEKGLSNQKIAKELCVSENTVKTHLKHIYVKAEVNNRTSLLHRIRS
ncbi:response regulator transcription factor [Pleomorphovibrio marinus]|uniref:response regulator transcription factor n=1 Tax=Pleomorphovibrio marinus TaxID=2164132 RepID=UPI0018E59FDF|nr:LuxR C-terminal-related transcriptional regulator [Pleomorphovibrio marinus]